MVETKKTIEQIQNLKPYLPEKTQEELDEILAYWEKIKVEWERKKKEFWANHDRNDFMKLLEYKKKNKKEIEWQYKYLDVIKWVEREKFIEEYLYDDILYGGKLDEKEIEEKRYYYTDWKEWNIVVEEWVSLDLSHNEIWAEWAKAIVEKLKLKRWVELHLDWNHIWDEWAEVLSKMELKDWILLNLSLNKRVSMSEFK